MKSSNLARILAAAILLFVSGYLLSAQQVSLGSKPKHPRYKLVDLGTLGGANSL